MGEFATAFDDADTVQVLDIYAASEEPIAGVDSKALVKPSAAKRSSTPHRSKTRYAGRWPRPPTATSS